MTTEQWNADYHLDAKGLACPMPLLKLKQQLNRMSPGQHITVETTDAGSLPDFEAFCKQAGHALLAQATVTSGVSGTSDGDAGGGGVLGGVVYRFWIRKSPPGPQE